MVKFGHQDSSNSMYSNKIINNVQEISAVKNHNHYFESALYSYTFRFNLVTEGTSQLCKQITYLERERIKAKGNKPQILSQQEEKLEFNIQALAV